MQVWFGPRSSAPLWTPTHVNMALEVRDGLHVEEQLCGPVSSDSPDSRGSRDTSPSFQAEPAHSFRDMAHDGDNQVVRLTQLAYNLAWHESPRYVQHAYALVREQGPIVADDEMRRGDLQVRALVITDRAPHLGVQLFHQFVVAVSPWCQ